MIMLTDSDIKNLFLYFIYTCRQYCSKLVLNILSPSKPISVSKIRPFEVPKRIGPVVVSEEFEKFHPTAVISCPLNLLA